MDKYKDADSKCPEFAKNWTLLKMACKEGRLDMVKYYHQERNYKLNNSKFLVEASKWGHLNVVKYLIENGMSFRKSHRSVIQAIRYNHIDVVEYFSKRNPELFSDFEKPDESKYEQMPICEYWKYLGFINSMNELKMTFYKEAAFNKDPTIFKRYINMNLFAHQNKLDNLLFNFDKLNDYVRSMIACHPLLISSFPGAGLYGYVYTKGLIIKLKTALNGRITNKYLMIEILIAMDLQYTNYQLFSIIS